MSGPAKSALLLIAIAASTPLSAQTRAGQKPPDPMTFELVSNDPDAPVDEQIRWIAAKGGITPDTGRVFDEFAKKTSIRGLTIYFNSPGGSVLGGLDLGEKLRKANAKVAVGRSTPVGSTDMRGASGPETLPRHQLSPNSGQCNSACSYAFLGGASRSISSDAFFGVHMFWPSERLEHLYEQKYLATDIERVQRIAGRVAAYMQRMGVDLRMLEIASFVPHKAPIRKLSPREIVDFKIASIDYGVPVVAKPGSWGLSISSNNANLLTGGVWTSPGRPEVRYQLELSCSQTRGFHDVRFEQAISKPLENGKGVSMRRILLVSGAKDGVIAVSGKDIRALPPLFTRLTASRQGSWIAKSGTIVSEVIENAVQRPSDGLKLSLDEGEGVFSEIPVPLGNLAAQFKPWQAACEKLREPKSN